MWSDLEYLSVYFKKLKSYPDTKDNILIRISQDEAPGAPFTETKWMLLAPNVCLAFLLDSFPRHHSQITNLSAGKATLLSFRLWRDGYECIYIFCPPIKKSAWSISDVRIGSSLS